MALVNCPVHSFIDPIRLFAQYGINNAATAGNATSYLTAAGQKTAFVFQWPYSANGLTINTIKILVGAVTGTATIKVGLYTVSNGLPTVSNYGGSSTTTGLTAVNNAQLTVTLGTGATITGGDFCALVVEPDTGFSGTVYAFCVSYIDITNVGLPNINAYATGAWGTPSRNTACVTFQDSNSNYIDIGGYYTSGEEAAIFNSGSTYSEYGNQMTVPIKCRITGIIFYSYWFASSDFTASLYTGTTSLASTNVSNALSPQAAGWIQVLFSTPYVVSAGTSIVVAISATTTNNMYAYWLNVTNAGQQTCCGFPSDAKKVTRSGGAWTTTDTSVNMIFPLIDQLDNGASTGGSGGGLHINSGMSGGMSN